MTALQRLLVIAVASGIAWLSLFAEQALTPTEEVRALNVRLASGEPADAGLLTKRAEILGKLMENDPAAATELFLPEGLAQQIRQRVPEAASLVEREGAWEGPATLMVEDHFDTGLSRTRTLVTAGPEELEVFPAEGRLHVSPGQRVYVQGTRLGERLLADSVQAMPAAADPCSVLGEQHIAVVFVETPSYKLLPSLGFPDEVRNLLTDFTALNFPGFLADVSFGRISSKIEFSRTYQLSRNFIPNSSGEQNQILAEIAAQADKDIDFSYYNRIFVVMSYPPMSGLTGLATMGCSRQLISPSKGNLMISPTFVIFGSPQPAKSVPYTFAHEFGHELGLHHADTFDYAPFVLGPAGSRGNWTEYGDFYSNMGDPNGIQSDCYFGHWNAQQKATLNLLERGSSYLEVDTPGTYRLTPLSSPGGLKAIRVRRVPGTDRWIWLEYRQPVGYEADLAGCAPGVFSGALMHYDVPAAEYNLPLHTLLLDATAAETPGEFRDAALAAGKSWSDLYGPLTIQVDRVTAQELTATVRYDEPCASLAPYSVQAGSEGAVGTIGISAAPACAWSAVSSADWLVITSSPKGTGAGTLNYAISPNRGLSSRSASIGIGRREFKVEQAPYNFPPRVTTVTPASTGYGLSPGGSYNPLYVTVTLTDPNSIGELQRVSLLFNTSPRTESACHLEYNVGEKTLRLAADDGSTWSDPRPLGSADASFRNSQCMPDLALSSVTLSAGKLVFKLAIRFEPVFEGRRILYVGAQDAGGARLDWLAVGMYDLYVNRPPVSVLTPKEGSSLAQTFTITAKDQIDASNIATVSLSLNSLAAPVRCLVSVLPTANFRRVALATEDGRSFGTYVSIGPGASLQNSVCGVDVSSVTISQQGTSLIVTIPVVIMPGRTGEWATYSMVANKEGLYGEIRYEGTWTAPANSCAYALDPPTLEAGAAQWKGAVNVITDPGCPWLVTSNSSWIQLGSSLRGEGPGSFACTIPANTGQQRTGSLTIMGTTITVTQSR